MLICRINSGLWWCIQIELQLPVTGLERYMVGNIFFFCVMRHIYLREATQHACWVCFLLFSLITILSEHLLPCALCISHWCFFCGLFCSPWWALMFSRPLCHFLLFSSRIHSRTGPSLSNAIANSLWQHREYVTDFVFRVCVRVFISCPEVRGNLFVPQLTLMNLHLHLQWSALFLRSNRKL